MLGDGSGYLNNRRFLKRVRTDHATRDLASDGDEGDGIEKRVGQTADEIGCARTGSGDADAGPACGARVAFGGEDLALFVAEEVIDDDWGTGKSLVDLHGSAAGVSEDVGDSLEF